MCGNTVLEQKELDLERKEIYLISASELYCWPKKPLQLINESKVSQATSLTLQYGG